MLSDNQSEFLRQVARIAAESGSSVLIVGGLVRDALLGQVLQDRDLDLVVEGDALPFARACANEMGAKLSEFARFHTAKLSAPKNFPGILEVDIASTRAESYPQPGALPEIKVVDSIRADLQRRDFSINCLAVKLAPFIESMREHNYNLLEQGVIDYFGGLKDLRAGIIRILHARSFEDDPTRLYRACRYAARLGAHYDEATRQCFEAALKARNYDLISVQRRVNEIRRMLEEPQPAAALQALSGSGLAESLPTVETGRWPEQLTLLAQQVTALTVEQSFEIFLILLFAGWPGAETPALGLKRERLKQLRRDAALLARLPPTLSALSSGLLAAALCVSRYRADWTQLRRELSARGYFA